MTDVTDIIVSRRRATRGLSRAVTWSVAVHVAAVVFAVLVPRDWLVKAKPPVKTIVISLGGSVGPQTSGMTAAGARPIEQVAPQPKRPEPIRPAAAKPDVMTIPEKPTKQQPPPKSETPRPPAPVTQPLTTGRQITPGNSRAETGAKGEGTGLTLGGGGTGGPLELANFCCPAYLADMVAAIKAHGWKEQQPVRGKVIMKFTIQRDGRVVDVTVEEGTEYLLNRASTVPLLGLQLKPLPAEFTEPSLTIHLSFIYQ
jgi:outer membrane biosynthesis protein TonB